LPSNSNNSEAAFHEARVISPSTVSFRNVTWRPPLAGLRPRREDMTDFLHALSSAGVI
jgi:hypothetical protein